MKSSMSSLDHRWIRPTAPAVPERRPGFTLVEMLVAITIIITLAAILVLILPKFNQQQQATRAGQQVQGWFLLAKQWAIRDVAERGLQISSDGTTLTYVQTPADFSPGTQISSNNFMIRPLMVTLNTNTVTLASTGQPPWNQSTPNFIPNPQNPAVNAGDYLLIPGENAHQIQAVTPHRLTLWSNITAVSGSQPSYRIVRQPQAIPDEATLQLPTNMIIDINNGTTKYTSLNVPSNNTIMFSPSGAVTEAGAAFEKIILYVRDNSLSSSTDGEPTLVTIYTRTGFIATYPVNTDPNLGNGDPYYFTNQGQASGM